MPATESSPRTITSVAFHDTPPLAVLPSDSRFADVLAPNCVAYEVVFDDANVVWVLQQRSIFDEKYPDEVQAEVERVALLKAEGKLGIVDQPDVSAES